MSDILDRIENRIHDAPMPTEHLLDEAADVIRILRRELECVIRGREKMRLELLAIEDAKLGRVVVMNDA